MLCLSVALNEAGRIARREYTGVDAATIALGFLLCRGFYLHQDWLMFYSTIAVLAARGLPTRTLLIATSATVLSATVIVIGCSQLNIIRDVVIDQGAGRLRHCLGFLYTLYPAQYILNVTLVSCYLLDRSMRLFHAVILLFINMVMLYLTRSRTIAAVAVTVIVVFFLRARFSSKRSTASKAAAILSWAFPLAAIMTFATTIIYIFLTLHSPDFARTLNVIAEGRFALQVRGLQNFGVRLFGQTIQWVGSGLELNGTNSAGANYNYIDNLFIHSLIQHGIIFTIGLISVATVRARKALRDNDIALLIVFAAIAIQGLVDDLSLALPYCSMWLTITAPLAPSANKLAETQGAIKQ